MLTVPPRDVLGMPLSGRAETGRPAPTCVGDAYAGVFRDGMAAPSCGLLPAEVGDDAGSDLEGSGGNDDSKRQQPHPSID